MHGSGAWHTMCKWRCCGGDTALCNEREPPRNQDQAKTKTKTKPRPDQDQAKTRPRPNQYQAKTKPSGGIRGCRVVHPRRGGRAIDRVELGCKRNVHQQGVALAPDRRDDAGLQVVLGRRLGLHETAGLAEFVAAAGAVPDVLVLPRQEIGLDEGLVTREAKLVVRAAKGRAEQKKPPKKKRSPHMSCHPNGRGKKKEKKQKPTRREE